MSLPPRSQADNSSDPTWQENTFATPIREKQKRKGTMGRHLVRWNPGMDQLLLLTIEYYVHSSGIQIDWNEIGRLLREFDSGESPSGESIKQHLIKVRRAREVFGQRVPPQIKRSSKKVDTVPSVTVDEKTKKALRNLIYEKPAAEKPAKTKQAEEIETPAARVEEGVQKTKKRKRSNGTKRASNFEDKQETPEPKKPEKPKKKRMSNLEAAPPAFLRQQTSPNFEEGAVDGMRDTSEIELPGKIESTSVSGQVPTNVLYTQDPAEYGDNSMSRMAGSARGFMQATSNSFSGMGDPFAPSAPGMWRRDSVMTSHSEPQSFTNGMQSRGEVGSFDWADAPAQAEVVATDLDSNRNLIWAMMDSEAAGNFDGSW